MINLRTLASITDKVSGNAELALKEELISITMRKRAFFGTRPHLIRDSLITYEAINQLGLASVVIYTYPKFLKRFQDLNIEMKTSRMILRMAAQREDF